MKFEFRVDTHEIREIRIIIREPQKRAQRVQGDYWSNLIFKFRLIVFNFSILILIVEISSK